MISSPSIETLRAWLVDARRRTLDLVQDLSDEELMGPQMSIVNPLLWELGHVAWFHERWVLRQQLGRPPQLEHGDPLYNSTDVAHDTRWDLRLPSRERTLDYLGRVQESVLARLENDLSDEDRRLIVLALFHEDMHGEAFFYTRQTLGYAAPRASTAAGGTAASASESKGPSVDDVELSGGIFCLGSSPDEFFAFDNERWAHPIEVAPFAMASELVSEGQFQEFVEAGGYRQEEHWSPTGWAWRCAEQAEQPLYWRKDSGTWYQRSFEQWRPIREDLAMIHVNYFEAEAYCHWAQRRLPTEAEWEFAATGAAGGSGEQQRKPRYPWGDRLPEVADANLDGIRLGVSGTREHSAGDTPTGIRQLMGNAWEWTQTDFAPYPGFFPDVYVDYSQPWFGDHKVVRGGAWATRSRMVHSMLRNFYKPERRDPFVGFRTCRLV